MGEIKKKINLTKILQKIIIKRMKTELKEITYNKLRLKNKIENKLKFYRKDKKINIKRIRINFDISIN